MNRATAAVLFVVLSLLHHAREITKQPAPDEGEGHVSPAARDQYAGDAACLPCHKDQALSYAHTAHHFTSQLAGKASILGPIQSGSNVLMIENPESAAENPGLYFKMEARDGGYYQTAIAGWPGQYRERTARMDVVIGAGVRGQSYLSWQGDELVELPVSYWSDGHRWINSPGYKNGTMDFSRPVSPRCLECHSSYIQQRSQSPLSNRYDRNSLVVGISCEKCHGPGKTHIALQSTRPSSSDVATTSSILNPPRFSRDRQVDLCALCHNGIRDEELAPAFSFMPGEQLDKYLQPNSELTAEKPNVHGNQVGLLKRSRCYQSSPNMSCSTCHDVHAPEKPASTYSSRCLSCHSVGSCGLFKTMGSRIAENCIDCHMPIQTTSAVVSETAGDRIQPKMRNHWIKIYR